MHELAEAEWVSRAFCGDKKYFDESPWISNVKATQEEAVNLCLDNCPVVSECLSYAQRHGESDGVWGGATPEYRKLLRLRVKG